jgi:hypothetical protein
MIFHTFFPVPLREGSFNSDALAEEFSLLGSDFKDTFEFGSLVEIISSSPPLYGVVRWSGKLDGKSQQVLVGVELVR